MTFREKAIATFLVAFLIGTTWFLFVESAHADVCVSNQPSVVDYAPWGNTTYNQIAQSFTVENGNDCTVTSAKTGPADTQGSDADDAVLEIWTDSAGEPGTLLEQGDTMPSIDGGASTETSTFDGTLVLDSGVTYWLVWSRTGSPDNGAYFRNAYGTGSGYFWNGGAGWFEESGESLIFSIEGALASSTDPDPDPDPDPTATTTTSGVINNPNQDIFNAIMVFLISYLGVVWLFRRR